jgi:hypothetical protein
MLRFFVVLIVLFGWVYAAKQASFSTGERQYSSSGKQLKALDLRSGQVVWTRRTSTSDFEWLTENRGVVVGAGKLKQSILIGNVGKNIYQNFDIPHFFGFESRTGKQLWTWTVGRETGDFHSYNGMLTVAVPNSAFAMNETSIIDIRSGRVIKNIKGDFLHEDDSQIVVGCEISNFPYCEGPDSFSVYRIISLNSVPENWTFPLTMWPLCSYIDMPLYHRTLYKREYFEILLSDGCGYLLSRYIWANGPRQKPNQRRVTEQTWPTGFQRPQKPTQP